MRTALFTITTITTAFLLAAMASPGPAEDSPHPSAPIQKPETFRFTGSLSVDADGSPRAYHRTPGRGLDRLRHAGKPGRWYGILTSNLRPWGTPVLQGKKDPHPGYFISITSLFDSKKTHRDPKRYTDAEKIPYIALPAGLQNKFKLGDLAIIYNTKTGKYSGAVFADIAPKYSRGEGSIALAAKLGIKSCPKTGGQKNGLLYLLFPGSGRGQGYIPSPEEIRKKTDDLLKKWGGLDKLKKITLTK